MKILVTGAKGQLGSDLMEQLAARGHEAVGVDVAEMDVTDERAVDEVIGACRPDAVMHCAAWTAVDAAEEPENREKVRAINALGTEYIAKACAKAGCKMMYISTDYVFSGQGETPWDPDCADYALLNWYGETKLEGERAVSSLLDRYFIVRIAWVFGQHGKNFIRTMLKLSETHDTLRVVDDQIGTPTYTWDLARLLIDMIETNKYGYYHATNEGGFISWYDFACEIFRQAGKPAGIRPLQGPPSHEQPPLQGQAARGGLHPPARLARRAGEVFGGVTLGRPPF